jgi:hypothetical protein
MQGVKKMKKMWAAILLAAAVPVFIGTVWLSASGAGSRSDRPFSARYSVQELGEDFLKAEETMESLHPALYEFTDKTMFQHLFEEQRARINRPMTGPEFFAIIATVIARIGCGHSRAMVPDSFWSDPSAGCFPLEIAVIKERAYVAGLYDAAVAVPLGSEIVAIQDRPMPGILRMALATISSDGLRLPFKWRSLSQGFPLHAALQFGFPSSFAVAFIPPGQTRARQAELKAIPRTVYLEALRKRNPPSSSSDPNMDLRLLGEKSTAVLTIRSLGYYGEEREKIFRSFIDEAFSKIRESGIRNLILDLRGNSGGSPFAATRLLSYIEPEPVPYFDRQHGAGYDAYMNPIPRAERPFLGRLFTLIDSGCFSSTGHLLALMKFHRIGVLVGEESGGAFECHDASQVVSLPNTGIRISMARRTYAVAVQGMTLKTGVLPDDPVEPGIQALISGQDVVMERALARIAQSGSKTDDKPREFPRLSGPYLGQKPPGATPEVFAPGIVSTANHEHSRLAFSSDGTEIYWIVIPVDPAFKNAHGRPFRRDDQNIMFTTRESGVWSKPAIWPLTKTQTPDSFALSSGGDRLYYQAPADKIVPADSPCSLFVSERKQGRWSHPDVVRNLIPQEKRESCMTFGFTPNGNLYYDYSGLDETGKPGWKMFVRKWTGSGYADPELLDREINTGGINWCLWIAPDESYLIWSSHRPGGQGDGDLYISFRKKDGRWGRAINMGDKINTAGQERFPSVSPDGKYLFFARTQDEKTYSDFYWVDAKIIEELKPKELK